MLRSAAGRKLETLRGRDARLGRRRTCGCSAGADNGVRDGLYRDALEIRTASGSGLNAINALGMESYLLGVVPSESPASWPAAALQAQAVAARSYALTTNVNGKRLRPVRRHPQPDVPRVPGRDPSTNAAVAATAGQVVTYDGAVATTFFFSTSGGYTENVENVFTGGSRSRG